MQGKWSFSLWPRKSELVVGVALLLVFLSLTYSGPPSLFKIIEIVRRDNTRKLISQLVGALENYRAEYDSYPKWTGDSVEGGRFLFTVLDAEDLKKIRVRWDTGKPPSPLDFWKHPIRYRCIPMAQSSDRETEYALWSTGGDEKNRNPERWISSWGMVAPE